MEIEIEVEEKKSEPKTLMAVNKTDTGYSLELVDGIVKFIWKLLKK